MPASSSSELSSTSSTDCDSDYNSAAPSRQSNSPVINPAAAAAAPADVPAIEEIPLPPPDSEFDLDQLPSQCKVTKAFILQQLLDHSARHRSTQKSLGSMIEIVSGWFEEKELPSSLYQVNKIIEARTSLRAVRYAACPNDCMVVKDLPVPAGKKIEQITCDHCSTRLMDGKLRVKKVSFAYIMLHWLHNVVLFFSMNFFMFSFFFFDCLVVVSLHWS